MLETLISRGASHRIAFVVLSAVQMVPRMQGRAGADPRGAAGPWADRSKGSIVRGCRHSCLSCPGAAWLARRCPRADVRARGTRFRGAARTDRLPRRRRPTDRSVAAAADPGRRGIVRLSRSGSVRDGPIDAAPRQGPTLRPRLRRAPRRSGVRYPGRREHSLEGIDLSFDRGERVAVAGRTGAGKSTLTLAAAGFIPRVVRAKLDGRVVIEGVDTATAAPGSLLGQVGIVFSTPANQLSASKQTVREELAFGLENLGIPRDEMDARIDATLARLGDRSPRGPRAVRAVRRGAATGGHREHRRHGHQCPGPRRTDGPTRPGGDRVGRGAARRACPDRHDHPVCRTRPDCPRPRWIDALSLRRGMSSPWTYPGPRSPRPHCRRYGAADDGPARPGCRGRSGDGLRRGGRCCRAQGTPRRTRISHRDRLGGSTCARCGSFHVDTDGGAFGGQH